MFFKSQNNVPDVYTNESRDFQLIEKVCDVAFNTTLSNLSRVQFIRAVSTIDAALLTPLASYLGFFTELYYPERILRSVLTNFREMIQYKGTLKGISLGIKSLQDAFSGVSYIDIKESDDYKTIVVTTDGVVIDQSYVDDVLRYVLPVGVRVIISYKQSPSHNQNTTPQTTYYVNTGREYQPVTNKTTTFGLRKTVSTIKSIH